MDLHSAELDRSTTLEDVPVDRHPRNHVVEAHTCGTAVRATRDVAPSVPADHHSPVERIAEHVDAPLIVRFLDNVPDRVKFDQVVVPFDTHRRGGDSFEVIVRDPVSTAVEVHGRRIGPLQARDVRNEAVLDDVAGRSQGGPVAARHPRTATAERVHCTAEHRMLPAVLHDDRIAAEPLERTAGDDAVRATTHVDAVPTPVFDREPGEDDVLCVFPCHERKREDADRRGGPRPSLALGWEPVQPAALAVQIPLANAVQFTQHIHSPIPLAGAVAVLGVGFGKREHARVCVDAGNLLELLVPVPEPVAVEADVRFVDPCVRTLLDVPELPIAAARDRAPHGERVGAHDLPGRHKPLVGPAGERLRNAVDEQLGRAAQVGGIAEIADTQCREVRFAHAVAHRGSKPLLDRCVGDRPPAVNAHTAGQDGCLTRRCLVHNGGRGGTGIFCRQSKRLGGRIRPAVDDNPHTTRRKRAAVVSAQFSHGVARASKRGQRRRLTAAGGIVTARRNVQHRTGSRQRRQCCAVLHTVSGGQPPRRPLCAGHAAPGLVAVALRGGGIRCQTLPQCRGFLS